MKRRRNGHFKIQIYFVNIKDKIKVFFRNTSRTLFVALTEKANLKSYLKLRSSTGFLGRDSMNEKCGSKQINFERTLICNEKFTI